MSYETVQDFASNISSKIQSVLPAGVKVQYDQENGSWNIDAGDIYLSVQTLIYAYSDGDRTIRYQVLTGDRWDNLYAIMAGEVYTLTHALVALAIEYNAPRPTINDLVREADEASL